MRSLFLFLTLPLALAANETLSRLTFLDQTVISGTVTHIDPEKGILKMTSPFLKGEAVLKMDELLDIQLNKDADIPESDHHALATVEHHYDNPFEDTIRGSLIGVDDQSVTLHTWYAGKLKLDRFMVKALDIYANSPSLYHGPNGLDGWVSSGRQLKNDWSFKKRALVSKTNNSIAREVEMSERSKFSFRAHWQDDAYFRATFLSTSGKSRHPSSGYSLQVNRTYLNLSRNGQNNLMHQSAPQLREQTNALFEFYIDRRPEGKNAIYIDGKKFHEWDGVDDTAMKGKWILFSPQTSNKAIKISDIIVSLWDGRLPIITDAENPDATGLFEGMEGQRIDLANGDSLLGKIMGVNEGATKVKTSLGDVIIPVNRLRSFQLHESEETLKEPRMYKEDVRAWFTEGGFVTLKIARLNDKKIAGYSQVFGDAEFDLTAFSRIEFNIWDNDLNEERDGGGDGDW